MAVVQLLCTGARDDDLRQIAYAILAGISPNVTDRSGRTPLHYAASEGASAAIAALLSAHANLNAVDSGGSTPLNHALYSALKCNSTEGRHARLEAAAALEAAGGQLGALCVHQVPEGNTASPSPGTGESAC